jgi:hypothetical protein
MFHDHSFALKLIVMNAPLGVEVPANAAAPQERLIHRKEVSLLIGFSSAALEAIHSFLAFADRGADQAVRLRSGKEHLMFCPQITIYRSAFNNEPWL